MTVSQIKKNLAWKLTLIEAQREEIPSEIHNFQRYLRACANSGQSQVAAPLVTFAVSPLLSVMNVVLQYILVCSVSERSVIFCLARNFASFR